MLKFNSQNKYSHLKLIILDCIGTFYRSKGIKATALKFQHIKVHIYMKLIIFTFSDVYISIRISSSMHLVILVAPTFHFIKTLKDYFLWLFMITLRWTGPNNGNRTLAQNTSKMVNENTILDKLPFLTNMQLLKYYMQNLEQKKRNILACDQGKMAFWRGRSCAAGTARSWLLNLNLNSLLVKRRIDNPSPGAVTGGN